MATAAFESILPGIVPFPVPRRLQKVLSRVLGINEIVRIYDQLQISEEPDPIADRLLKVLDISFLISADDLKNVPKSGSAIVAVNHPFGILDGAILASLLTRVRPDVRFVANGFLTVLPELASW